MRDWAIYVFAWMKKPQLENWIRRKNHGAKLATSGKDQKCSVVLTPESVRRSSARMYRRAKIRLRRAGQSPRLRTEEMETSECLDFDFDDMKIESDCVKENCGSVSKELPQCNTVNTDNSVEKCNVHSTHIEHPASPGTAESEVVHTHININANDERSGAVHVNETDDLMCDQEVSIILERGVTEEVLDNKAVNAGHNNANDSDVGGLTSELTGKNLSAEVEQHCAVPVEHQATICEDGDVTRSPTVEAEGTNIQEQIAARENPAAMLLNSNKNESQQLTRQDNDSKGAVGDNEVANVASSERVNNGKDGPSAEQCPNVDINLVTEVEVIGGVDSSLNSQPGQDTNETPREAKKGCKDSEEASLMHTENTVAEDVQMDVTGNCEAGVGRDTLVVTDTQEGHQDSASVPRQGNQEVEIAIVCKDGHDDEDTMCSVKEGLVKEKEQTESQRGSGEVVEDKIEVVAVTEASTGKEPIESQAADDTTDSIVAGKTNTAITNKSPIVSSVVVSSAQLRESCNEALTAQVSTPNHPSAFDSPIPQRPFFNTVPMPIIPVTSHFPAFPPLQGNTVWPVVTHADPFATAGMVPVHTPLQHQGNYGYNPTWVDHTPHAPFSVGCVQSHSASGDICPPGTEGDSLEPSSNPVGFASGSEMQEATSLNTDENQSHGSVMDHSVVTALMQFYSEIEDVEGSENKQTEGFDDSMETVTTGCSFPKALESAQTECSKDHEAPTDMEIESDQEGSHNGVSEGVEISEIGDVSKPVLKRTESFDRSSRVEDKSVEVESTETSAKQSPTADGIAPSEMDITCVENDHSLSMDGTVVENSEVSVDITQVEICDVQVDGTVTENPDVAMNVTLTKNPGVTVDEMLTENPADVAMDITLVENTDVAVHGTQTVNHGVAGDKALAENPGIAVDNTLEQNPDISANVTLAENPDVPFDGKQVTNPDIALDVPLVESPGIAIDKRHAEEPIEKIFVKNPDVATNKTLEERLDIAVDGTHVECPGIAIGGTRTQLPDVIMEGFEEEHPLSPIDPLFMASAEQTIFSSIGDLRNLLGQSSTFDRIAEETIASTVSSLEDVLRQAHSSYLESSSCPSDSGVSVGEEVQTPSRAFGYIPVSMSLQQNDGLYKIGSVPVWSTPTCLSGGVQSQMVTEDARTNEGNDASSYINKGLFIS